MASGRELWENRPLKAFTGTVFTLLLLGTFFVGGPAMDARTALFILGAVFASELVVWLRRRAS